MINRTFPDIQLYSNLDPDYNERLYKILMLNPLCLETTDICPHGNDILTTKGNNSLKIDKARWPQATSWWGRIIGNRQLYMRKPLVTTLIILQVQTWQSGWVREVISVKEF